jgi:hypothetical protein
MDKFQSISRALQPVRTSTSKIVNYGFELITFDNLVDQAGNPISIKVMEHEKESLEAAKRAGKRAAQSFNEMFK